MQNTKPTARLPHFRAGRRAARPDLANYLVGLLCPVSAGLGGKPGVGPSFA